MAAAVPEEGRFLPGTLVAGRYRVIGLLGRGGMGEVYRATDLTLAQSVALKFLPEDAATNERLLERFHNEVRIARQVSHPNVCRVYDIGEADGLPFISMEYIDGEDLASLLQRIGRLPSDKALEISRKLCAGLAAAHERGVIHRDLKPHNIMLNKRGEVVIMDFGLAAVADSLEGPEARNGTPAYMSPEQLRGESVTAKSDLYALGLLMYELFTGKRAFDAQTLVDLVRMQENSRPASISSVASDVDPAVEKVILRCLQMDPAQRPASALSVAAALPGGDPLAAALAAGETPSPELVAASGETEGFAPRYAIPCIAFVLIGLLAIPFISTSDSMLPIIPFDYPPAVLAQKARDIAASHGYVQKPADWIGWLTANEDFVTHFEEHPAGPKNWKALFAAESPVRYFYRQSPRYLVAPPDGDVWWNRPPMNLPGMLSVELDSAGRLRAFSAIAPRYDDANSVPKVFEPEPLFREAGLDVSNFHETQPAFAPALAFDARRAWSGPYPGLPGTQVTIEAATYRGSLTCFVMRWPWTKPPVTVEEPGKLRDVAFRVFETAFLAVGLFCGFFFARLNLRAGRGDRAGAWRLAFVVFLLGLVRILTTTHFVPLFDDVDFLFVNAGLDVLLCAILWVFYIALEPAVRARWPHSMITWNRLLAGQFGDPRLGSHILVGVVMGVAMRYLFEWRHHWLVSRGANPAWPELDILLGPRSILADDSGLLFRGILFGSVMFFLLCGLRALLRRDWIAALVAALLVMLTEGDLQTSTHLAIDVPLYVAIFFILGWLLLRMGLVPAILTLFTVNIMGRIPAISQFTAWYNPVALVEIATIGSIALYGFWRSQSKPPPAARAAALSVSR
jgi:serine/threonine-protein kinase